jgi:hypothetical protein
MSRSLVVDRRKEFQRSADSGNSLRGLNVPALATRNALAAGVFTGSFLLRFLSGHFHGEHFIQIAGGRQIVGFGNLPLRDFVDPGMFLLFWSSAAAQWLFGYNLLGDAVLSNAMLSAGTTLVFLLAVEASASVLIGLVIALMFFMTNPLLYNYYKIFWTAFAVFASWRYVDKPTYGNLALLAIGTAVAAITRGDMAVYVGLGAAVALLGAHWKALRSTVVLRAGLYGLGVAVALTPFFGFLQLNGGVVEFYRTSLQYGRDEKSFSPFRRVPVVYDPSEPLLSLGPPPSSSVSIRWTEDVTPEVRTEIERRYQLADPQLREDDLRRRTWRYKLQDLSAENVTALLRDKQVDDTNGIEEARHLASWQQALPVLRIRIAPGFVRPENGRAFAYYLFWALPAVAVALLLFKWLRSRTSSPSTRAEATKILAASVIAAVANQILMTQPTHNRMSDVGAPLAILGAWIIGQVIGGRRTRADGRMVQSAPEVAPPRTGWLVAAPRALVAMILLAITWASIGAVANVGPQLQGTPFPILLTGPRATSQRLLQTWTELGTSPPIDRWDPGRSTGLQALGHYVRDCTKPTDALLVTSQMPILFFYADRQFGGGMSFFHAGHFSDSETQNQVLSRLRQQSVPIVVEEVRAHDSQFSPSQKLIQAYLVANYEIVRESSFGDDPDNPYRILVDRRVAPSGTDRRWGLPCFA